MSAGPERRLGTRRWISAPVVIGMVAIVAAALAGCERGPREVARSTGAADAVGAWTCAMHPQIHLPRPGKCPICAMDLVQVPGGTRGAAEQHPRRYAMSAEAVALADVETAPVRRGLVAKEVRMVGKVDYDETRLSTIAAWVPGRIDRVYVDYTGVPVKEGEHLVYLYSPELRTTQDEFLQARKAARELGDSRVSVLKDSTEAMVDAAREKLRLLGLTRAQQRGLEKRGASSDHLTVYSPIGGTVVEKNVFEGMYVETGTPIYKIADLSKVWVRLDAYESDMSWIRYGQDVAFTTEAYAGETFHGRVAFIEPILDPRTRTVKVRVNVDNADGRLKPEMFVRAIVRAGVTQGGKVMDPEMVGKWIGPMHPEIVREGPGDCPVCGMPLVRAEEYGYVAASDGETPLLVPASAPLITGERAVVYVRVPGQEEPTFDGREIVLGPRTGDDYVVREGLREGEEVVVRGNFKIDSALQIQARPSMMSDDDGAPAVPHAGHAH